MPGGSKKGGGLETEQSAFYKMKGSPMQRNFGIGESPIEKKVKVTEKKGDVTTTTYTKKRDIYDIEAHRKKQSAGTVGYTKAFTHSGKTGKTTKTTKGGRKKVVWNDDGTKTVTKYDKSMNVVSTKTTASTRGKKRATKKAQG